MNIDEKQGTQALHHTKKNVPREAPEEKGSFSKLLDTVAASTDYKIKRGDTLWHIVKSCLNNVKANSTNHAIAEGVKRVTSWNVLQNPDLIFSGSRLDLSPLLPGEGYSEQIKNAAPADKISDKNKAADLPALKVEQVSQGAGSTSDAAAGPDAASGIQLQPDSAEVNQANKASQAAPFLNTLSEQMAKYKVDQLLAAPGGKKYEHHDGSLTVHDENDFAGFTARVGKDLQDAKENIFDFGRDLTSGSVTHYITADGEIKTRQKTGLLKTAGKFVKDMTSGLSFGAYMPEGEERAEGQGRIKHFFNKVFNEALLQDAAKGVPSSIVSGAQHALLAAWNALEAVPDATIGNFQAGRKLTNTVFDNGQVAVSYITDIVPGGEAWFRVHAPGSPADGWNVPVYYNFKTGEQGIDDPRWGTVRNTPFRKTIETIGALLADTAALGFIGKGPLNFVADFPGKKD